MTYLFQNIALLLLLLLPLSGNAQHTFSIVAVDTLTGEIGSAGATCLTSDDCGGCGGAVIISGIIPGRAAINAQAQICLPNTNLENGLSYVDDGLAAQSILDQLLINDTCNFGDVNDRQYGIVTLKDGGADVAGYTGDNTLDYAGHLTEDSYSIQGNILIADTVLTRMETAYLASEGLPLSQRLMAALQGANIPGADSRCLADGISSRSSYIRVAKADDNPEALYLDIKVESTLDGRDPIDSLQTLFDVSIATTANINNKLESEEKGITVFPNPTNNELTIEVRRALLDLNSKLIIRVFDSSSKLVLERNILKSKETISLSSLANGVLYYEISRRNGQLLKTGQIIKNGIN